MSLNNTVLNGTLLNGPDSYSETGVGLLVSFEQTIVPKPIPMGQHMINGRILNGKPALNSGVELVGAGQLVAVEQRVGLFGLGEIVEMIQGVGYAGSGSVVSIEQEVIYYQYGSGLIINCEQTISNTQSGNIINIEQKCRDFTIASHLDRCGWDVTITLAGNIVPNSQICGEVRVERAESSAALAEFTIIPPVGIQAVEYYAGKAVTIDVETESGNRRIYTGVVDVPEVDIIGKRITFRCTDRRKELINAQISANISTIGYYSDIVFQDVKDTADELEKRLSTTPVSVDFDVFGTYTVTSWFAKATADYVLSDSDIYYERPRVEWSSRANTVNEVNVRFQYRYERLHQQYRDFIWTSPIAADITLLLRDGYTMTYRAMVLDGIKNAGWPVKDDVSFTAIWPSGWYGGRGWSTVAFNRSYTPAVDADGDPILDASGNQTISGSITGGTDLGPLYCMGATWRATTRWAQSIVEDYGLRVYAPQSQTQYGAVKEAEEYSSQADFDISLWENYTHYTDLDQPSDNFYINKDTTRVNINSALYTALNKARTSILAAHRDTKVTFNSFIRPEIDLKHTVEIDTTPLAAKGKVSSITHVMTADGEATSEIVLSLFKSTGSASDSTLLVAAIPADTATYGSGDVYLGNHFGEDPTQDGAETWTGMIGNRFPSNSLFRTSYTEQFIVDTPAIPNGVRNEKELDSAQTFTIEIPDDPLTIIF